MAGGLKVKNLEIVEEKDCAFCDRPFTRPYGLSILNWTRQRFCTKRCATHYRLNGNRSMAEAGFDLTCATTIASQELLKRCIVYGLRHNSDLGMGREAFMSRARELGLTS